jgi:polysaccharide deacetylase family protein (PEP-CTERM system associated)
VRVDRRHDERGVPTRRHALSVDVEDWYHDVAVGAVAEPQSRVEANTLRLLELLGEYGTRATFFFLGTVAERCPHLVRQVASAGHELGSHGYTHRPVPWLSRAEFRAEVTRSLRVIEDACGEAVRAYRAPYFSIAAGMDWPLDVLRDAGVRYDSSILSAVGRPALRLVAPRVPYALTNGLWEIPVAVLRFARVHYLPMASGAGLRLLPPAWFDYWLRRFEREVGAGLFYLHPWELDAESPTAPRPSRWLLRLGRRRMSDRLRAVLRAIQFGSIDDVFGEVLQSSAAVAHRTAGVGRLDDTARTRALAGGLRR